MLLWNLFLRGGIVMWPLLLCSIGALGIILDRLWFFYVSARGEDEQLISEALSAIAGGRRLEAMQALRKQRGPGSNIVAAALAHAGQPGAVVEEAMSRAARMELVTMQRGLGALEAIITVAPLLGLLGTVTGIIRVFNVVGALAGLSSPAELAPGIAEALFTTAFGLMIAVPSVIFHAIFTREVDRRVTIMNNLGGRVLQAMRQGGERS
ncbi:MAG TPA: MotA/TolQ/ExbB proton channel family protein [Firmicutes bacterium]|nr:MotA/TolQ/ExbB proton channel family protein [Bacillota bacterium]